MLHSTVRTSSERRLIYRVVKKCFDPGRGLSCKLSAAVYTRVTGHPDRLGFCPYFGAQEDDSRHQKRRVTRHVCEPRLVARRCTYHTQKSLKKSCMRTALLTYQRVGIYILCHWPISVRTSDSKHRASPVLTLPSPGVPIPGNHSALLTRFPTTGFRPRPTLLRAPAILPALSRTPLACCRFSACWRIYTERLQNCQTCCCCNPAILYTGSIFRSRHYYYCSTADPLYTGFGG